MLWTGFRLHLLAGIALTAVAVMPLARLLRPWLRQEALLVECGSSG
jgi:hypothetical protein